MSFSYDRLGFPMMPLPDLSLEVHLLPVTKIQFERFIAEADNDFGSNWYKDVLALNARVSYKHFTANNQERLFITGVLPEEALAFARWLGRAFDLPTREEWRAIYQAFTDIPISANHLQLKSSAAKPAHIILENLLQDFPINDRTLVELTLMREGLVEWASTPTGTWVGLGQPRSTFFPNLLNPLSDEFKPLEADKRLYFFGFRLIRRRKKGRR